MNLIVTLIVCIWFVRIVHNIICYVNLWWVKEYRLDRMRIHLGTDQGKKLSLIRFTGFHISPKTISLVLLCITLSLYLYALMPFSPILRVILLDIISFPLTALVVLCTNVPTGLYHRILIGLATKKLRAQKNLLVIGITGSYGKTSTKEYLATILGNKFRVLKTDASKNSAIGIAETVLQNLKNSHEIFIVEMGAYKKGEIRQMCEMVRPQVGIMTAINEQHQDLFGSIVSTMHAKYELVEGLTGKKTVVMNQDNLYVREMMRWAAKDTRSVWAYTKEQKRDDSYAGRVFTITNQRQSEQGLSFTLTDGASEFKVVAPIFGVHQIENITAAIAASVASGMSVSDAVTQAKNVAPVDRMMKPIPGINGATFIDDTFNNNPEAAIAAIEFLRSFKGKKILVFQPMIELGDYANSAHARVGENAANVCDEIILTNTNYQDAFLRGVHTSKKKTTVQLLDAKRASSFIRNTIQMGDAVLFKGKESARVLGLLT